jgi:type I restriction enzyme S subunit
VSGRLSKLEGKGSGIALRESILADRARVVPKRRAKPVLAARSFPAELPAHWAVVPLDEIAGAIEYGTSAKTRDKTDPDDVPVLRMGNIQGGALDVRFLKFLPSHHEDVAKLMLEDGDLLFNRTNSAELVGKTAVYRADLGPMTFASYLIRCQLMPGVSPDWVSLVINSLYGRRYIDSVASQQVGQANVNGSKLAAMPIPLPPSHEQEQILQDVREFDSASWHLLSVVAGNRSRGAALRRSLLEAAFAGHLVPQDPADDPASILLARIKAERATAKQQPKLRRTSSISRSAPKHTSAIPTGIQEELPL